MRVARKREECQVRTGNEQLEQVDTMKYLVVMTSDNGSMQQEVEVRVGCASRAIGGLNQAILGRRELSKQTKLKVVNATVMPVLMYGCIGSMERAKVEDSSHTNECTEEDRGSVLEGPNHKCEILQRLVQVGVLEKVKKRQEDWKERLCRRPLMPLMYDVIMR